MKKVILASASPRRADLLRQVGVQFDVVVSDVNEEIVDLPPGEFAKNLAFQKAKAVSKSVSDGVVIAADTVVALQSTILGKPTDEEDSFRMLSMLSDGEHEVYTGLCVVDKPSGHYFLDYACTKVVFRKLTTNEIKSYIATGEPADKAGAYGIQGKGALLVQNIEGCYFNVVGLPLSLLYGALQQFDISLL